MIAVAFEVNQDGYLNISALNQSGILTEIGMSETQLEAIIMAQ